MSYGVCKLTGKSGKLVRCHLLPKALTRTPELGEPRIESGEGLPAPRRRFDGWYDKTIVTRAGEDVLAFYDDKAIPILRRLGLVWSSSSPLKTEDDPRFDAKSMGNDWYAGYINVAPNEAKWLRLFFLSLLWRAATTTHPGFDTIKLTDDRVELLRGMLLRRTELPLSVFPVSLFHLNTDGGWHMASPTSRYIDLDGAEVATYRFYLDGLVAIIHDETTDPVLDRYEKGAVGAESRLFIVSRPFEGSHQEERINSIMYETYRDHGPSVDALLSKRKQKPQKPPGSG